MSSTTTSVHHRIISSSVGALLVSVFTTPFDVVKVRLQAQLKPERVKCSVFNEIVETICFCSPTSSYNSPVMCTIYGNIRTVTAPTYSSTRDALVKIAKSEGVLKLWTGLPPTLLQSIPQTVVYFTAYDQLKYKFGYVVGEKNALPALTAGVTARLFAVVAVSPIELLRTKIQSKKGLGYGQLLLLVINAIKHDGILSMWRGLSPTLFRDVPFSAFYWASYETIKSLHSTPSIFNNFCGGALSGMFACVLTNPFDVVKTFRQIELGEVKQKIVSTHRGVPLTFHIMTHLYQTKGFTSLYTGIVPRCARVAPACAIMISTYEYGKKYFSE